MDKALRPLALTLAQYACLELLTRMPDQSSAQLARGAFVTPQSMNEVLHGLQARGLVERPDHSASGRARPARLTPAGQKLAEDARGALAPVEQRLLGALSPQDRQRVLGNLRAIIHALEETSPG
jgi:DNA-binding MarR family transcriptional regulator